MKTKSTLLCVVLIFCLNNIIAQVNVQDSLALVDFYNSTDGPHWKNNSNWLTSKRVATWYGIYVNHQRVLDIILNDNGLKGTIPSSLGNLTQLVQLYIYNNQLSGSIPDSIGNTNLFTFIASNNMLSGSIPASIGKLANLDELYLDNNQLNGNLPSSMSNLSLMYLDLHNNQLTGSIPSLGTNGYLLDLNLSYNHLTGSIPSSIGKFASYVNLSHNQLTGNIPASFYNGTDIAFLYLDNNQLSGSIPEGIGNFLILRHLYLNDNHFTGEIPSSIGKLTWLNSLNLSHNELSGSLPYSIGNIGHDAGKPVKLFLNGNNLTGNIPNSISNLPSASQLNLSYNEFTFAGMQLVARKFSDAKYAHQQLIPVHQKDNTLSVSAGGTLSKNTYTWFRNGSYIATFTGDSVFHPTESGEYRARVTNSIAAELVLYSKLFHYEAPAITSVENGLQQFNNTESILVYPNPVRSVLYVQTHHNTSVSLIAESGKILVTTSISGKSAIDISNLRAGLYYLKNNNTGAIQKVVIAR